MRKPPGTGGFYMVKDDFYSMCRGEVYLGINENNIPVPQYAIAGVTLKFDHRVQ